MTPSSSAREEKADERHKGHSREPCSTRGEGQDPTGGEGVVESPKRRAESGVGQFPESGAYPQSASKPRAETPSEKGECPNCHHPWESHEAGDTGDSSVGIQPTPPFCDGDYSCFCDGFIWKEYLRAELAVLRTKLEEANFAYAEGVKLRLERDALRTELEARSKEVERLEFVLQIWKVHDASEHGCDEAFISLGGNKLLEARRALMREGER